MEERMTKENLLVTLEKDAGLATITLQAPPANCYSYEMMRQLDQAILDVRMDPEVQVIVMTGSGEKFFCAGADIGMLQEADPTFKYYFCLHANETLLRLEQTPKLVIAAINGHCVGGGLEVAMACDLRWARNGKAKIGLPEVKLGVLPGTGGTARLTRLVGKAKAIELMVEGRNLDLEESRSLGLIQDLIDSDSGADFSQKVKDRAQKLCAPESASMAIGCIKRSVQTGADMGLEQHLALERELQQRLFTSADAKEGISSYNEKRPPRFQGQ
jgi:enoyl-CoA hydratase